MFRPPAQCRRLRNAFVSKFAGTLFSSVYPSQHLSHLLSHLAKLYPIFTYIIRWPHARHLWRLMLIYYVIRHASDLAQSQKTSRFKSLSQRHQSRRHGALTRGRRSLMLLTGYSTTECTILGRFIFKPIISTKA